MKRVFALLILLLLITCAPLEVYTGSVIVSNETASVANVTVDGDLKSIPAFDFRTWDIEWTGDPWKNIIISIPGDVETYELFDDEVVTFRVY